MNIDIEEKLIEDFVERLTQKAYKEFVDFISTNEFAKNDTYLKNFIANTNIGEALSTTRKSIEIKERENIMNEINDSVTLYLKRK